MADTFGFTTFKPKLPEIKQQDFTKAGDTSGISTYTPPPVEGNMWGVYTDIANKYGITPMSVQAFNDTMGNISNYGATGAENIKRVDKQFSEKILRPLYDQIKGAIKTKYDQYWQMQKDAGNEIPYQLPAIEDFSPTEDYRADARKITSVVDDVFNTVTHNVANKPKTEAEKTSEANKGLLTKLDNAKTGGIISQDEYDKFVSAINAGQGDAVNGMLQSATEKFLLGDITAGAPDLSTFKAPEFSSEQVDQWYKTLSAQEAPLEAEQLAKTKEYYNAANPFTTGSGAEIKQTSEMLAKNIADRYSRAMGLGQQDYEKKYNLALADWENKYKDYWTNIQRRLGTQDYAIQRGQYEKDRDLLRSQNLQDVASAYNQNLSNMYKNRAWSLEDQTAARQLAEMAYANQPKTEWREKLLTPVVQGVAQAGTSALIKKF